MATTENRRCATRSRPPRPRAASSARLLRHERHAMLDGHRRGDRTAGRRDPRRERPTTSPTRARPRVAGSTGRPADARPRTGSPTWPRACAASRRCPTRSDASMRGWRRPNGLEILKVRVPLGVIARHLRGAAERDDRRRGALPEERATRWCCAAAASRAHSNAILARGHRKAPCSEARPAAGGRLDARRRPRRAGRAGPAWRAWSTWSSRAGEGLKAALRPTRPCR